MGILLCEQNFRDVWSQNESVRAEIGQILHTDTRGSISSKDVAKCYFVDINLNMVCRIFKIYILSFSCRGLPTCSYETISHNERNESGISIYMI